MAIPENLIGKLTPPSYWKFLAQRDIVVLRAQLGDKLAIEALRDLSELQLKYLLNPDKPTKTLTMLTATDMWKDIQKTNPPIGEG